MWNLSATWVATSTNKEHRELCQNQNPNSMHVQCLLSSRKLTLLLEFTVFQDLPAPPAIFKDFPVLENVRLKFNFFLGFPGPILNLSLLIYMVTNFLANYTGPQVVKANRGGQ